MFGILWGDLSFSLAKSPIMAKRIQTADPQRFPEMLPRSSLASIEEIISANRDREEKCADEDLAEAEKSANFGRTGRTDMQRSIVDLLLGPEFESAADECESAVNDACEFEEVPVSKNMKEETGSKSVESVEERKQPLSKDWTCQELLPSVLSKLVQVKSLTIFVPRTVGGSHKVVLPSSTLNMLRGNPVSSKNGGKNVLSWLDDNVIDGFTALINVRSRQACNNASAPHRASGNSAIFSRARVRTFIFSSQFYTIWTREHNGGYDNVRRWRRKVPEFNSVGMFLFPALVNSNHWVLAVIDIEGQQFIYYDPLGHPDKSGVINCAMEWVAGEVKSAKKDDVWDGLQIDSWPILSNPENLPVQKDFESCGVFVLYVAEHMERGVTPRFDQADIPVLRMRMLLILSQGNLPNESDPKFVCETDDEEL